MTAIPERDSVLTFVVNASDTTIGYNVIVPGYGFSKTDGGSDSMHEQFSTLDNARQRAEQLYADGKRRTLVWKVERVMLGDGWRAERETLVLELVLRV